MKAALHGVFKGRMAQCKSHWWENKHGVQGCAWRSPFDVLYTDPVDPFLAWDQLMFGVTAAECFLYSKTGNGHFPPTLSPS